ncbi:MAG: fimbrillin family protein [Bacteroides sp.]|nr:fimbrillin family protein [Bacteroides sp.]
MKTRLFITLAAATLALAACNNDEEPDNWNGEIRLASGVTVQTRTNSADVPDKQIADGLQVGVFINDATTSDVIGGNLKYDANGNGSLTLATTPMQTNPIILPPETP